MSDDELAAIELLLHAGGVRTVAIKLLGEVKRLKAENDALIAGIQNLQRDHTPACCEHSAAAYRNRKPVFCVCGATAHNARLENLLNSR